MTRGSNQLYHLLSFKHCISRLRKGEVIFLLSWKKTSCGVLADWYQAQPRTSCFHPSSLLTSDRWWPPSDLETDEKNVLLALGRSTSGYLQSDIKAVISGSSHSV